MRMLLLFAFILLSIVTAAAQHASEPTIALVEARLRALKLRTNLTQEQLNQVSAVYKDTLEQIKLREDWVKQSEQLKAELEERQQQSSTQEPKLEYPQNATPEQLQQFYEQATTSLNLARDELAACEQKLKDLVERRKALPEILAEAKLRLDSLNKEQVEAAYPELDAARQMFRKARIQALTSEIQYYEAELLATPLREKLLTTEREEAARRFSQFERLTAEWRTLIAASTRSEAEKILQLARKDLEELASNPVLKQLAEQNLNLAQARLSKFNTPAKIDLARVELDSTRQKLIELHDSFTRLRNRVAAIGLTDSTGVLLRKKMEELPDAHEYRRRISSRQQELSSTQLKILEFEEELARSTTLEESLREQLKKYSQPVPDGDLKRLLQTRTLLLKTQITELNSYFDLIMELDIEQQKLVDEIARNRGFIEENILWVKTLPTVSFWDLPNAFTFLKSRMTLSLISSSRATFAENVQRDLFKSILLITGALLAIYALYQIRLKLRRYISQIGVLEAARPGIDDIPGTVKVFFSTLLLSTFRPVMVLILWAVLGYIGENSVLVHALAKGLQTIIVPYLTTRFLLAFTMPMGLAQAHLEWSEERISTLRTLMRLVNTLVLPATFFVSFLQALNMVEREQAVASRIAYILSHLVLAYVIFRLSHPTRGVVYEEQDEQKYWLHTLICAVASLTPLLLALFSAMGYYYAATHLSSLFGKTVLALSYLITLKAVAYSLVIARASRQEEEVSTEEQKSLEQFKLQAYRMVSHGSTIIFMLFMLFIWTPVVPALTYLNRVELWSTSVEVVKQVAGEDGKTVNRVVDEKVSIKLTDLIICLAIALITVVTARNVPGFIEIVFLQRLPFDAGARYAFTVVSRYVIITTGLILSAGALGIKWGQVQWMVAAISVGLGFGLQEIFSNFISGLIILFERPVRVGDIVTVGETTGTISRIRIRSTTVTDYDMKELIIPNKNFITGQVINWTLSTSVSRVTVPVQVAYNTDTALVVQLLRQAVDAVPLVLKEPPSRVLFVGFGQHGLDYKLFFYIPNRDVYVDALSQVNEQINALFNKHNISIPYPQLDVHMRSSVLPEVNRETSGH